MSFEKDSNFQSNAGISRVLFGDKKPLLPVELNEMQQIQNQKIERLVAEIVGDGINSLDNISYADGVVTISKDTVFSISGHLIKWGSVENDFSIATGETLYLQAWEETVTYNDTLKEEGNQHSSVEVDNTIMDADIKLETSRRKVLMYQIAKTVDSSKTNMTLCSLTENGFVVEVKEFSPVTDILSGVTAVGNALKLNGLTAEEFVSNENLFDNAYFPDAVNSSGKTSWNGNGTLYTFDKWILEGTSAVTLTLNESGATISLNGTSYGSLIYETKNLLVSGEKYTVSVKYNGEVYSRTITGGGYISGGSELNDTLTLYYLSSNGRIYLRTTSTSPVVFEWVKLEKGSVATPFVPPNKEVEKLKCGVVDAKTLNGKNDDDFLYNGGRISTIGFDSEKELWVDIDGTKYSIPFGMLRDAINAKTVDGIQGTSIVAYRVNLGTTDISHSNIPAEGGVWLTSATGLTGLPTGWGDSRHALTRLYNGNAAYSLDFLSSYGYQKLAWRMGKEWEEIFHTGNSDLLVRRLPNQHGGDTVVSKSLTEFINAQVANGILSGEFTFFNINYTEKPSGANAYGIVRFMKHLDNYITVWFKAENQIVEHIGHYVYDTTTAPNWNSMENYFPIDGSVPMSGNRLFIANGYGVCYADSYCVQIASSNVINGNTCRFIEIKNSNYDSNVNTALLFRDMVNGVITDYNILHTGNMGNYALAKDGTAEKAKTLSQTLPVSLGGTGATTAAQARANLGAQASLGFTPVQQGTGTGQLGNTIKIGWSGSRLKCTVDTSDMGNFVFDSHLASYRTKASGSVVAITNDGTTAPTDTTVLWAY